MKAIFLDRDGTINKDPGYFHDASKIEYFTDVFSALKELSDFGFCFFVITNQSGIGRGYFEKKCVLEIHEHMKKDFAKHQIELKDIAYCPHTPEDKCECRKPNPKMVNDLCEKWNINKNQSYILGDKISDVKTGINANIRSVLINTRNIEHEISYSFNSLTEFVEDLKKKMK